MIGWVSDSNNIRLVRYRIHVPDANNEPLELMSGNKQNNRSRYRTVPVPMSYSKRDVMGV